VRAVHALGSLGPVADVLAYASISRGQLSVRLLVALGLTYLLGFERELRGSTAGDRTFSLVGLGSAVVGFLALHGAPNALAGVVTGIGFLGAGVILHGGSDRDGGMVRGVTTAATFFLAAAVGAAAGQGDLLLATEATGASIVVLELPHVPFLQFLDGHYWSTRFRNDRGMDDSGESTDAPM
jgi:putative Mg2+ transporter-C (MgtC) family protein